MSRHTFDRKQPKFAQKKRFLIVVEGAVTECQYFNAIRTLRRISTANIEVIPPGPTSPVEMVEKALQLRNKSKRSDPYDQVWCVFDAEAKLTQPARVGFQEALDRAGRQKIQIAYSNPCFELWILLHHEDCNAWKSSDAVKSRCSQLNCVQGKKIQNIQQMLQRHDEARRRAEALVQNHDQNGTTTSADRNPETTVHLLVDALFAAFPS